jgi:hypothetical protein
VCVACVRRAEATAKFQAVKDAYDQLTTLAT